MLQLTLSTMDTFGIHTLTDVCLREVSGLEGIEVS